MAKHSFLAPEYAQHRAFLGLILVILVPLVCADWLNDWTLFVFPLGTFVLALLVPIALIAVAFTVPREADDEPEQP